jgi:hypothetical protein
VRSRPKSGAGIDDEEGSTGPAEPDGPEGPLKLRYPRKSARSSFRVLPSSERESRMVASTRDHGQASSRATTLWTSHPSLDTAGARSDRQRNRRNEAIGKLGKIYRSYGLVTRSAGARRNRRNEAIGNMDKMFWLDGRSAGYGLVVEIDETKPLVMWEKCNGSDRCTHRTRCTVRAFARHHHDLMEASRSGGGAATRCCNSRRIGPIIEG